MNNLVVLVCMAVGLWSVVDAVRAVPRSRALVSALVVAQLSVTALSAFRFWSIWLGDGPQDMLTVMGYLVGLMLLLPLLLVIQRPLTVEAAQELVARQVAQSSFPSDEQRQELLALTHIDERSIHRWARAIEAITCLALVVMLFRVDQIWNS